MIRVLIVDDHRLFRLGLQRMLADAPSIKVVGEACSGEEAVQFCRDDRPDVVLMDIRMPGIGGLEALSRIMRLQNGTRVIALTACEEQPFPAQMMRAGASGYLTKGVTAAETIAAIRKVFVGQKYFSADVAQQLAFQSFGKDASCPFDELSGREMQIAMMVVDCQRVQRISQDLHLSPKTVNSYRYRIFEKLRISSNVELALLAVRHGMIDPMTTPGSRRRREPLAAERTQDRSEAVGRTDRSIDSQGNGFEPAFAG